MMDQSIGTLRLDERHAIVTGGASGIGRDTAIMLAELGADVVVTDVDEDGGAAVAEQIGGRFAMLDVGDPAAWERVVSMFGPFDIAVLNAGVSTNPGLDVSDAQLPILSVTDDAYRRIMSVNLDGVVFGMRAVLPAMVERGTGDVIATASMAGLGPIAMDPVYGLTKHGVVGLVRSVAQGCTDGSLDICVSAICPGFTDTNIIGEQARSLIDLVGLEIMSTDRVTDAMHLALAERAQGGQWVVWPGQQTALYEWNDAIEPVAETPPAS